MGVAFTLQSLLRDLGADRYVTGAEDILVTGVSVDSRTVEPGALFVALPGERTDGHRFVSDAFASGAPVALVSQIVDGVTTLDLATGRLPHAIAPPVAVRVHDTLEALQTLARARRAAHPSLRVVGVTGSVGKTTTKEAIAAVLARRYEILKNEGNQNNEIGLPLTLMRLGPHHQRAVLEMGMYDLGEIAALCRIAAPDVGVVTNVGPVHLERLGSIERIAQAKGELLQALPPGGTAVLDGDDRRVAGMRVPAGVRVVTYGLEAHNDVRAVRVQSRGLGGVLLRVAVRAVPGEGSSGECDLRLRTLGAHSSMSALAAVAVGLMEGLAWDDIQEGLEEQGWGVRLLPKHGRHGGILLDDSYNASPVSALAALQVLGEMRGRRVAVLGDMLELGDYEEEGHRVVGRRCAEVTDVLVTVGACARTIAEEAQRAGLDAGAVWSVSDADEALALLGGLLGEGDVVLVKGSRSVGLEKVVAALEEAPL